MKKLIQNFFLGLIAFTFLNIAEAITKANISNNPSAPNPGFKATISAQGNTPGNTWPSFTITLTNISNNSIEMNGSAINFVLPKVINDIATDFGPLSWTKETTLSVEPYGKNQAVTYIISYEKVDWNQITSLPPQQSIKLTFSFGKATDEIVNTQAIVDSVTVNTDGPLPIIPKGKITLVAPNSPGQDAGDNASASIMCSDNKGQTEQIPWQQQKTAGNLALGLCTVHTNAAGPYPGGPDQSVNLTLDAPTAVVNVVYQAKPAPPAELSITMQKPSDMANNDLPPQNVYIQDSRGSSPQVQQTSWTNVIKVSNLSNGQSYKVWANPFNSNGYSMTPVYTKDHPYELTADNKQPAKVAINYTDMPLVTVKTSVTLSGLPDNNSVGVTFIGSGIGSGTKKKMNLANGTTIVSLVPGNYYITTDTYHAGDKIYRAQLTNPYIVSPQSHQIDIPFSEFTNKVIGWPDYLAMGTVTDDGPTLASALASSQVDAIFKYAGGDGAGDQGFIIPPDTTAKTIAQTRQVEAISHKKVMPVMVVYTADASGSLSKAYADLMNYFPDQSKTCPDCLMKHYVNLILETNELEKNKDANHPYPGTIILNPDFMGMLQQFYGQSFNPLGQKVPVNSQLIQAINYIKQNYPLVNNVPSAPPTFDESVQGYMQSINYVVRTIGPDIKFGWEENLWALPDGGNWLYYASDEDILTNAATIAKFIQSLGVYSGPYKPDFIVFDRYERDDFGMDAIGGGYAYHANQWKNYLLFVKTVSSALNEPAMLWQIPGGHMVTNNESSKFSDDWIEVHAASAPQFFFGDKNIGTHLQQNVDQRVLGRSLILEGHVNPLYGNATTVGDLLATDEGYDWAQSNLQNAVDSNVFAILWGGGSTTGVVPISTNGDDNGWLTEKVQEYFQQPVPVK